MKINYDGKVQFKDFVEVESARVLTELPNTDKEAADYQSLQSLFKSDYDIAYINDKVLKFGYDSLCSLYQIMVGLYENGTIWDLNINGETSNATKNGSVEFKFRTNYAMGYRDFVDMCHSWHDCGLPQYNLSVIHTGSSYHVTMRFGD